jgi:hypothetical protein
MYFPCKLDECNVHVLAITTEMERRGEKIMRKLFVMQIIEIMMRKWGS